MKFITALLAIALPACLAMPSEFNPRIIGGSDAFQGQFKYQVSLQRRGQHNCGGSILSPTKILSAAHCFGDPSPYTVVAGNLRIGEYGGQSVQEAHRIVHPEFDRTNLQNDVAIIYLETPLEFNDDVQPISLRPHPVRDGEPLTLSGWGYTAYGENVRPTVPTTLQWIQMPGLEIDNCQSRLGNLRVSDQHVCTIMPAGQGACMGDSGGPLVDANGQQVGVVSWGIPCARGLPDVFAAVAHFHSWINNN